MIPITILTGFLGAGKTTLLNHLLHAEHGLRVAVLVNDFGAINIDSQLIVGIEGETVSLANGCICCTIRGDLQTAVERLLNRAEPPEYLLVEASGVSDPAQIALTFTQTALRERVRIDAILTVVDAEQFDLLDKTQRQLAEDQIRVADMVMLNKVDLVTADELARLRAWIERTVPQARIFVTTHAQIPLEFVLGVGRYDPLRALPTHDVHVHEVGEHHDHDHDHDHSLVFSTWHWSTAEPISLQALYRIVDDLPPTIYRAKGFLYVREIPQQMCVLQVVGKRVTVTQGTAWGEQAPQTTLVLIGAHGTLNPIELAARFAACAAPAEPLFDVSKFMAGVFGWLRRK